MSLTKQTMGQLPNDSRNSASSSPSSPTPPHTEPSTLDSISSAVFSPRSRRQLGLFFAGATFLTLSALITRRSLVRRYQSTIPSFYQHSNRAGQKVNGANEAFEALNLATLNVTSAAIMMTGGMMWALDISTIEELRHKFRGAIGVNGIARSEAEAEEEMEEWLATVLARKEQKEAAKRSVAESHTKGVDSSK